MSQVVIITGMHRSGTSLVSSLLQRAGVDVGHRLMAANDSNPRGYFEDVDFYEFHEGLLHARKQSYLFVDDDFRFEASPEEVDQAARLIGTRSQQPLWGWKDPRTTLFLDFWREQLPSARFLFVYRSPLNVLMSLVRRGEFDHHPLLSAGVHAWHIYNSRILDFCRQHPDSCVLIHIDELAAHLGQLAELLRSKLQLDVYLEAHTFGQIYQADELQRALPRATSVLMKIAPELLELYKELNGLADLAPTTPAGCAQAGEELSHLDAFISSLPAPIPAVLRHGLLHLLIATLAPERSEAMLRHFGQSTQSSQQVIDQLLLSNSQYEEAYREAEKWLATRREEIHSHVAKIEIQWINPQTQHQQLREQNVQIESLVGELARVYATPPGKVIRSYWRLKERLRSKHK